MLFDFEFCRPTICMNLATVRQHCLTSIQSHEIGRFMLLAFVSELHPVRVEHQSMTTWKWIPCSPAAVRKSDLSGAGPHACMCVCVRARIEVSVRCACYINTRRRDAHM